MREVKGIPAFEWLIRFCRFLKIQNSVSKATILLVTRVSSIQIQDRNPKLIYVAKTYGESMKWKDFGSMLIDRYCLWNDAKQIRTRILTPLRDFYWPNDIFTLFFADTKTKKQGISTSCNFYVYYVFWICILLKIVYSCEIIILLYIIYRNKVINKLKYTRRPVSYLHRFLKR